MKPSLVLPQTRTGFEQSQGSGPWEHWDQGDGILQLLQGHSGLGGGRKQHKGTAPTTGASPETDPRLPLAVDFHSLTHELGQGG